MGTWSPGDAAVSLGVGGKGQVLQSRLVINQLGGGSWYPVSSSQDKGVSGSFPALVSEPKTKAISDPRQTVKSVDIQGATTVAEYSWCPEACYGEGTGGYPPTNLSATPCTQAFTRHSPDCTVSKGCCAAGHVSDLRGQHILTAALLVMPTGTFQVFLSFLSQHCSGPFP